MFHPVRGSIFLIILLALALSVSVVYVSAPHILYSEEMAKEEKQVIPETKTLAPYLGKAVVVNLNTMMIELKNGTSTLKTFPIISKGKPGSYYETPGGNYENHYKEINHFSSIGHVYMPFSVHIFGNFFIHGIPYYPDGTKVSSTYSGGCIRLTDENARRVYDFIEKGNPIIITQNSYNDFENQNNNSNATNSIEMTRYMTSVISLEFLTQDDEIDFNGETTTRRKLLYNLLTLNDNTVSQLYARSLGTDLFIKRMNEKAKSIGLNNTLFKGVDVPAETTDGDIVKFSEYIKNYKSYLLK